MTTAARPRPPWTVLVGLGLLAIVWLAVVVLLVVLGVTAAQSGGAAVLGSLALYLVVLVPLGVALVMAALRRRWARWFAAITGILLGVLVLGFAIGAGTFVVEILAGGVALAAGGALLLTPAASRWFAGGPAAA